MAAAPFLHVLAGPNGSGKSTLAAALRTAFDDGAIWINADEIAAALRTTASTASIDLRAAQEADARRLAAVARQDSFMTETVMSDSKRWLTFFSASPERGIPHYPLLCDDRGSGH